MNPINLSGFQSISDDVFGVITSHLVDTSDRNWGRVSDLVSLERTCKRFKQVLENYKILTNRERCDYQLSLAGHWTAPTMRILDIVEIYPDVISRRSLAIALMQVPPNFTKPKDKTMSILLMSRAGNRANDELTESCRNKAKGSSLTSLSDLDKQRWKIYEGQVSELNEFIRDCVGIPDYHASKRFKYFSDDCFRVLHRLPPGLKTLSFVLACESLSQLDVKNCKQSCYAGFLIAGELAALMPTAWNPQMPHLLFKNIDLLSASKRFLDQKVFPWAAHQICRKLLLLAGDIIDGLPDVKVNTAKSEKHDSSRHWSCLVRGKENTGIHTEIFYLKRIFRIVGGYMCGNSIMDVHKKAMKAHCKEVLLDRGFIQKSELPLILSGQKWLSGFCNWYQTDLTLPAPLQHLALNKFAALDEFDDDELKSLRARMNPREPQEPNRGLDFSSLEDEDDIGPETFIRWADAGSPHESEEGN